MSDPKPTSTELQDKPQSPTPTISLPKGGGAIRGMGEKFAANPVTGTGSMSVPIATSPGRSGFGPQLSLSYDSGSGNGPFGFGWHLSLPAITRKTDKGLPQYRDSRVEEGVLTHPLPPSSNRTCGFPASGFPLDFFKRYTQRSASCPVT